MHRNSVKLQKSLSINAPPQQVFGFWSNFGNFQTFIPMISRIHVLDRRTSCWHIRAPLGHDIEFTSTIIEYQENERLVWESVHERGIARGEIRLIDLGGRTRLELDFEYSLHRPWMQGVTRLLNRHGFPSVAFDHGLESIRQKIERDALLATA